MSLIPNRVRTIAADGRMARLFGAAVLLTAVALKSFGLPARHSFGGRASLFFDLSLLAYEFLLAGWLISNVRPVQCRYLTISSFLCFCGYALFLGISGAGSCGCFGQVHVSPWSTVFLDSVIVALLCAWRPHSNAIRRRGLALASVIVSVLIVSISLSRQDESIADGVSRAGSLIILEPEEWQGKAMPLLASIDIGDQLAVGRWSVLFYHRDCPKCQEAIVAFTEHSEGQLGEAWKWALVEMPPYGAAISDSGKCHKGRMDDTDKWFMRTPVELQLSDGLVLPTLTN